jgi:hypothetical protein
MQNQLFYRRIAPDKNLKILFCISQIRDITINPNFLNSTVLVLAEQILRANYPTSNVSVPVLGNDQLSRFFLSPVMELVIRHVFFLFVTSYIQNQASLYANISQISYYMTPLWIENRLLFKAWNVYGTTYIHDLLYVDSSQVKVGDKWGMMIVKNYNTDAYSGQKTNLYPYVTDPIWIDWKIKNSQDNQPMVTPSSTAIANINSWLHDTIKEEYVRAVMISIPF